MSEPEPITTESLPPAYKPVAFSNSVRLTGREWLGVGLFAVLLVLLAPSLWKLVEPFEPGPDYRMPYELSNDYWHYDRWSSLAAAQNDVLVIGDSVVWGPYVAPGDTLSSHLAAASNRRFANLGLNGAHPVALAGLLEYYAGGVKGKAVLLQCNPLWMTSAVQDLQEEAQAPFNHPRLVPQFSPRIPRYKADVTTRLGNAIARQASFTGWTDHLQAAYFEEASMPKWTLEHPYENPLRQLAHGLPTPQDQPREEPVPWFTRGIKPQEMEWVDPATSLQWQGFRRAVAILQERGNRVFVLVGPYNEHILKEASRQRYQEVKQTIVSWLQENNIPYLAPPVLERELYGDASHPLAGGYQILARQLLEQYFFQK